MTIKNFAISCLLILLVEPAVFSQENDDGQSSVISPVELLAKDLAQTLEGLGENQVLIGKFTGPAVMQANAGAGICKQLSDALAKQNVTTSRSAKFAIQGSYTRLINDKDRVQIVIRGNFENNHTGQSFGEFEKVISASSEQNIANLAKWFGINAHVPTNVPTKLREKTMVQRMRTPEKHLDSESTKLRTTSESPYAIELLTWSGQISSGIDPASLPYVVRKIAIADGAPIVPIQKGEAYAVRLINDSPATAAVSITIDGLSMFSFAGNVGDPLIILQPKSTATIYGWYRTAQRSDVFKVTKYADSAVAELKVDSDSVGIISVAFRKAWTEDQEVPDDEFAAKLLASRGGNATGRGTSVLQNFRPWVGQIGAIRDVISLRYQRAD